MEAADDIASNLSSDSMQLAGPTWYARNVQRQKNWLYVVN